MKSLLSMASFLFPLLIWCFCLMVDGRENQAFHVVSIDTLKLTGSCSPTDGSKGNSAMILHRYDPRLTRGSRLQSGIPKLMRQDKMRVQALHRRLLNNTEGRKPQASEGTLSASSGVSLGSGNYVVTIGIGTPKIDQTVMFDTGSDVCWVQCQPCANFCHAQQEPIFDPSASSSYRNVSCATTTCEQLDLYGCDVAGTCKYGVEYVGNSTTVGLLSQDTLTLTPTKVFEDFVFGCGQDNRGLYGETAGLLGLSRDALSVVSQTSETYGKIFSYCLPVQSCSTGELTLGGSNSSSTSYTPMLTDVRAPSLYALELTGISVGGEKLTIAASVFSTAGTIIDSGTVITRLPPAAYAALSSAFRSRMTDYTLGQPLGDFLDTCYDMTGKTTARVPAVALHFGGEVVLDLDAPGILVYADITQVCLAFAANSDDTWVGIIGNTQQLGREVVYDLAAARIGFGTGPCS